MHSASITVCIDKNLAHLSVKGRGTFENSENIKEFCMKCIEDKLSRIQINMLECTGMDSTFMGILTMLSRFGTMNNCPIELANVNEANKKNFASLGISKLLTFTNTNTQAIPIQRLSPMDTIKMDQQTKHKNILDAHQELIDANETNRPVFQDLITFLNENKQ